jgi:hypothetical protein
LQLIDRIIALLAAGYTVRTGAVGKACRHRTLSLAGRPFYLDAPARPLLNCQVSNRPS